MISFIMPAKNVSLYVSEAISALIKADYQDWELIIIEDHSTDNTLSILREMEGQDSRIRVFENKGSGKVIGLNYGYTLASGEVIKCIDADDVLDMKFFDYVDIMNNCDVLCHDGYVTTNRLRVIKNYSVDKFVLIKNFSYCLKYLKGLPRWTWSFTRSIGDKIFPIPANLPFEDVWFTLMIKKWARNIQYINRELYFYRQHSNQTYGGILNFDDKLILFRAKRMLKLIDVIEHEQTNRLISGMNDKNSFDEVRRFYELLAKETVHLGEIVSSGIPLEFKVKLLVYRKLSFLAPLIIRLKWFVDRRRKAITQPRSHRIIKNESISADCVKSKVK